MHAVEQIMLELTSELPALTGNSMGTSLALSTLQRCAYRANCFPVT